MMAKFECDFTGSCEIIMEQSVAIDGWSFLVIVGKHIRGGFIAISEKGIYVEASLTDKFYNAGKLAEAGFPEMYSRELADYIDAYIRDNGIDTSTKGGVELFVEGKGFKKKERPLFERAETKD